MSVSLLLLSEKTACTKNCGQKFQPTIFNEEIQKHQMIYRKTTTVKDLRGQQQKECTRKKVSKTCYNLHQSTEEE